MYGSGFISIFNSFADWWHLYLEIARALDIDPRTDYIATSIAYSMVRSTTPPLYTLERILMGRTAIIFGAGPSIEKHIDYIDRVSDDIEGIFISADGATKALIERGLLPHIIVSDLDGDLDAIRYSLARGSKLVVHVHGDNINAFTSFINDVGRWYRDFIVTTQVEPIYPIINFGGFTDGDRALALALALRAGKVILAGMDFGNTIGRYSKPWLKRNTPATPRKRVKLIFAYIITSRLSCLTTAPVYTLSDSVPECVARVWL